MPLMQCRSKRNNQDLPLKNNNDIKPLSNIRYKPQALGVENTISSVILIILIWGGQLVKHQIKLKLHAWYIRWEWVIEKLVMWNWRVIWRR